MTVSTRCLSGCNETQRDLACALHGDNQAWQETLVEVIELVTEERVRQIAAYGLNDECADGTGPWARWVPLRTAGETALFIEDRMREDYEQYKTDTDGPPTWMHLVREEVAEAFKELPQLDNLKLDEELLQVAALCLAWVEFRRRRRAQLAL